ncbi:MAG: ATP-binding protein [Tunicatimonas sp.]
MLISKNNALKSKVVIGFVLVLSALLVACWISYRSFGELTQAVNTLSSPDTTLTQIDQLLVTITQTENALQEYTVAKSPEKLGNYSQLVAQIGDNVGLLKARSDSTEKNVDSIFNLIDVKLVSLESFMKISRQRDEFDFYDKALKELEQGRKVLSNRDSAHFLEDSRRKQSLMSLERLNDLINAEEIDAAVREVTELPAESVKKILRQVRNQQSVRQRKINEQELAYLENNAQVMGSIHALLTQLKNRQQARYHLRSEGAKASIRDALIRIGIILLIALLSAAVIVYLILADITRSEFYKRRLLIAKSNAEKLARVKEDFLANMSHEIRTPLTAILGFAEQLGYTPLNQQQDDYLRALDASSQHLLALVNDVLDFSKIEAGGLVLEQAPFYVLEAVEEVQYALQPQAEKKGLYLRIEADEEQANYVLGDAFRLKQILYNLLSNAIKFTAEGGVTVSLQMAPHAVDECKAIIEVRDTGIGIALEKLDSVFQVFHQSDASTSRRYGGTGLGLSISKKLAEMQGGTIGVTSTLGQGSVFRVVLPYLTAIEPEYEASEVAIQSEVRQYRGRVLVIDDQPLNSQLLALALESKGVAMVSAVSGQEGLSILQHQSFDLIFCDLQMPEMDGKQVIRAIREKQSAEGESVPIIAFTANVLPQEKSQYEALGVSGFLFKPFNHQTLDQLLAQHLDFVNDVQAEIPSLLSLETTAPYTLAGVKQFTGADTGLLVDYLENLTRSYAASVGCLQQALRKQSTEKLSFYAHKMVSQAELLQHRTLTTQLKQLEQLSATDAVTSEVSQCVRCVVESTEQLIADVQTEMDRLLQHVA